MKKTVKIILMIFFLFLINKNLFSQEPEALSGDFGIVGIPGYNTSAILETVSAPFEGITSPQGIYGNYNRVGQVQNGAYWRFFTNNNSHLKGNVAYITGSALDPPVTYAFLDLGHCAGVEYPNGSINGTWGFAKYKITIIVTKISTQTTEVFKLYLNCLDSKYGDLDNGGYSRDLFLTYMPQNGETLSRIDFSKNASHIDYIYTNDILPNGEPKKEFKVWEVVPETPVLPTKNFFAKTTPFPICPRLIHFHHIRVIELGTDVTLDGVNSYTGDNDKWGYNTIDTVNEWSHKYFSEPPIPTNTNVQRKTYVSPATFYEDENNNKIYGFRLNVKSGNKLTIKNDNRLWVSGYTFQGTPHGDTICFSPGSDLVMESTAQLNTCRDGKIIDSSASISWGSNSFMHIYEFSEISFWLNNNVINNGAHIEVDANGVFKVQDNSTVTFSGTGTYLKLNPNAIVKLGENAKIEFVNGARLIADGTSENRITFSSINPSTPGTGIVLANAGANSSITYCTFNNLKTAIKIENDNLSYAGVFRNISNNIFNMNSLSQYGLNLYNTFNATIQYNKIYMNGSTSLGLVMRFSITSSGGEEPVSYAINVLNNEIYNGAISSAFISLTSAYVPVYVGYNNFNYSTAFGIVGTRVSGNFRFNNIISSNNNKSIMFTESTPNMYSNILSSNYINLHSNYSYEMMTSIKSDNDELILMGGWNKLTSISDGNVFFNQGKAHLDYGENCFTKVNNTEYKHLWGTVNEPTLQYNMRKNDFNGSCIPITTLKDFESGETVQPVVQNLSFTCPNTTDAGNIWEIRDLGNGIYDTIYYISDNTGYEPTQDESLYNTAILNKTSEEYFNAISVFKILINNYPTGSYTDASLFSLYECYEGLDTSRNQGITNALYGDLKSYLEAKIQSGLYSDEFESDAYQIITMCETKMGDYETAMEGYEFIALYHPDPYIRLLASWDFAELEAIVLGGGGISSKEENLTSEEYYAKLISKVNQTIKEDPIKKKVKKSYDKVTAKNTAREEKEVRSRTKDQNSANFELSRLKKADEKIINKTLSVLRYSKSLTKEEREKRQIEDIVFTPINKNQKTDNIKINSIPDKYGLSQNYPNPFNPVTKINYELPKDGKVNLVIYDILGREIKTLVNELKQAGRYTVEFNGSNFASGVYFYRIQSGNFVQVNKMLMIK